MTVFAVAQRLLAMQDQAFGGRESFAFGLTRKVFGVELNLSDKSLLTLTAEPNEDAEAEARLEVAANHVHGLVKDIHVGAASQLQKKFPPAADLVQRLVDGANVAKENGQIVIRIKRPDDLLETAQKLASAVEALIGSGETSSVPSR